MGRIPGDPTGVMVVISKCTGVLVSVACALQQSVKILVLLLQLQWLLLHPPFRLVRFVMSLVDLAPSLEAIPFAGVIILPVVNVIMASAAHLLLVQAMLACTSVAKLNAVLKLK